MKFLLTSSGITNPDIAQALADLVGKPLSEASLLFIPSAANTEGGDKRWLIQNLVDLEKQGFKSIDIADIGALSAESWQKRFEEADVVCVGGGNEIYLAELFERIGMKEYLVRSFGDKVYMGISAGSMVAGQFMPSSMYRKIFPEEDFGTPTSGPMNLYPFCFIPHLNSSYFSQIRKDVLEGYKTDFNVKTYSTDDETAIKIVDDQVEIVGKGEYWVSGK